MQIQYCYGDNDWRDLLTSYNGVTITYDNIGNPLSDGTWTYTWQHGRQLASMAKPGTTWNFTYNTAYRRCGWDRILCMLDFIKEKLGCFWAIVRTFLIIYALLSLFIGEDTLYAWLIIGGEIIELFLSLLYRWITTRKSRYYNREESFWSKRAEKSDLEKEE